MAKSANLGAAKNAKQDEFYTQLSDIEKEMRHYRRHFKDKTILCNCDDPFESNFFKFFVLNFNRLGLKKVIATCYSGSPIAGKQLSLFDVLGDSAETRNKPYKAVVTSVYDKAGRRQPRTARCSAVTATSGRATTDGLLTGGPCRCGPNRPVRHGAPLDRCSLSP